MLEYLLAVGIAFPVVWAMSGCRPVGDIYPWDTETSTTATHARAIAYSRHEGCY